VTWRETLLKYHDRPVAQAVVDAAEELLRRDAHLLVTDVHERSIGHHFANYLQARFPGWDVDCEYNRDGHHPKALRTLPDLPPDREQREVYPDIIVHHRNTSDNLLVLELKKTTSTATDEYDLAKLRAYVAELGYHHALFVRFRTGHAAPDVNDVSWSKKRWRRLTTR
jgi:hypothetical protein